MIPILGNVTFAPLEVPSREETAVSGPREPKAIQAPDRERFKKVRVEDDAGPGTRRGWR
jgi:hypothetical protein